MFAKHFEYYTIILRGRAFFRRHTVDLLGTEGPREIILLANVNSRSRSLYAIARPSVVCRLSVCRL